MMNSETPQRCILHELALALHQHAGLKAVWLDGANQRVSYACQPGASDASAQQAVARIVQLFQPADVPACPDGAATPDCALCARGQEQSLPPDVRMFKLPGAGVLLKKDACITAQRLWHWQAMPWLQVQVRAVDADLAKEWKLPMALAMLCGAATLAGFVLEKAAGAVTAPALAAYLFAYLSGGFFAAQDVFALLKKRVLDVHFLMLAVAVGAALIGHWWEGAVLLFLFSLSDALEDYAMRRTERAIHSLFKEAPREATVLAEDGSEMRRPVDSLAPGQRFRVRPGEQFPVDAEVLEGASASDESNLTGESVPVEKQVGDQVFAGAMNLWGRLDCRVSKPASESSLRKIIRLIQEAQESKAPSQRFTDKFGTTYTYSVLGLCLAMFLVWWLGFGLPARDAFYRAMTLLVVSSPCALVLSIPSAILASIAAAARHGILFRGGAAVERLAEVTRVALDKTGTLTTGHLQVHEITTDPPDRAHDLLAAAGALAHNSSHPVSQAIARESKARHLALPPVSAFRSLTGQGVTGRLEPGGEARMGRRSLFGAAPWAAAFPEPAVGVTETLVERPGLRGRILLRDEIRTASKALLQKLRAHHLRVTMLSGDHPQTARAVSSLLDLDDVQGGLSPEQKVERIRVWSTAGEKVAMVGDGVNDAPSLAAAYVGVAMGMRGSDAALEQADVVLMQDRLERFYDAYQLSRRARRVIRQNLAISLGSVAVLVTAAFFSLLPLTIGVIGHEGSTVVVVLNSLRLLAGRWEEPR